MLRRDIVVLSIDYFHIVSTFDIICAMEKKEPQFFSVMLAARDQGNAIEWDQFIESETCSDEALDGVQTILGLTALTYAQRYARYFDDRGGSRGD